MPHVIVKLYSGRSEQQKNALAEAITKAVMSTLKSGEEFRVRGNRRRRTRELGRTGVQAGHPRQDANGLQEARLRSL